MATIQSRYRAWHFAYPGIDLAEQEAGLQFSPQGGPSLVEGNRSIRQAILLLLSTRLGERVMRPDYGCELYRLLFSPNDGTTAGLAIHYVRRALERWEPRIDILQIDANRNAVEAELLDILLIYRVRITQSRETIEFSLRLSGGAL